jgi:hypothetical protein
VKLFRTPPEAVRAVRVDARRLAWGVTTDGTAVVATATTLHVGDDRLPWVQVEKAVWAPPVLTVTEVAEVEGTGPRRVLHLDVEHRLAEVVRAQVTSSVGWTDRRRLVPDGVVRVVGRRVPGQDALLWQVVWLEGTDPTDPQLRAQADRVVAELRGTLG